MLGWLTRPWKEQLHCNLTNQDKQDILQGNWLNDNVMSAIMKILQTENSGVSGLQDIVVAQNDGCSLCSKKFVQIINIRNNHWVVITNISKAPKLELRPRVQLTIDIYDSRYELNITIDKTNDIPTSRNQNVQTD